MTVVLAEDEPDIQLVARLALKRAGFTVRVVNNGHEALAAVREAAPDVVLLDWHCAGSPTRPPASPMGSRP